MTEILSKNSDRMTETVIDDEVVVMSLDTGDFFSLKDSAKSIWEMIDGKAGTDRIVDLIAAMYMATPADVDADVQAFIAELKAAGLVRGS